MIWGEIENSNSNFECLEGNENLNFEGLREMQMQIQINANANSNFEC